MAQLDGRVAIVTGATSGIGERIAELFVAEGARVVGAGRREAEGRALQARCGSALSFCSQATYADDASVKAMVEFRPLADSGGWISLVNRTRASKVAHRSPISARINARGCRDPMGVSQKSS